MPLPNDALDTFISQELSKLTACRPQSLAADFPEREEWFSQFVLRRIFQNHVKDARAALAFAMVRRADAALDEWELACAAAHQNVRRPSAYFKLLRHLENSVAALWQGLEFGRNAIDRMLFAKGDGSVYERLNWIYNVSRHYDPNALPHGDMHRVWVSNDGLHTREHAVSFTEMRDGLQFLAGMAQKLAGELTSNG